MPLKLTNEEILRLQRRLHDKNLNDEHWPRYDWPGIIGAIIILTLLAAFWGGVFAYLLFQFI